jgi:hypothetical protein
MSFLRRIFRRDDYSSEISQFISELKAQQPDLEARQRAGRAIFWDKHVNREAWDEFRSAQLRQKAYVYQPDNQ